MEPGQDGPTRSTERENPAPTSEFSVVTKKKQTKQLISGTTRLPGENHEVLCNDLELGIFRNNNT